MRRAPRDAGSDDIAYGALLDAVRGLRWRARRASRIAVPGIHPSRVRGTSAEFTEYRPYRRGDDLRRLDWKLFARSDRAHVRLSEERAVTPTCVVLDASASMSFPDGAGSKWSLAAQLAVALTSVAQAGGDPTGLMITGNPDAAIPPRTRRGTVAAVTQTLRRITPGAESPVAPTLVAASRHTVRVVIISDFLGDLDDTLQVARELIAAGRDVHALHIVAPEEIDPPANVAAVRDPESRDVQRYMGTATRDAYVRAYSDWRETTASRWLASGAAYRAIVVGREPVSHAVRRIVRDEPAMASPG